MARRYAGVTLGSQCKERGCFHMAPCPRHEREEHKLVKDVYEYALDLIVADGEMTGLYWLDTTQPRCPEGFGLVRVWRSTSISYLRKDG